VLAHSVQVITKVCRVAEFRNDLACSAAEVNTLSARSVALSDVRLAYLLAHEMAHVHAEHTREIARCLLAKSRARGLK